MEFIPEKSISSEFGRRFCLLKGNKGRADGISYMGVSFFKGVLHGFPRQKNPGG
jgi:hypothetical protein